MRRLELENAISEELSDAALAWWNGASVAMRGEIRDHADRYGIEEAVEYAEELAWVPFPEPAED